MHTHRTPIACPPAWSAVMESADYRCQCSGGLCGSQHSKDGHRCKVEQGAQLLIAAPLDLTLKPLAASRVPTTELRAWCSTCHKKAAARQRAQDRERTRQEPDEIALFDL